MRLKQMLALKIVFVTLGFGCFPAGAGEIEDWLQSNPDFHITAETYSNAPYWLMPTNIPYRLLPVENGKWIWTTNMNVPYYDVAGTPLPSVRKVFQLELQEKRRMDETDPPGIANVPEYHERRWDQKHVWNTNVAENWQGVWAENTNTGWRVGLKFNGTNTPDIGMNVYAGSVVINSGPGLLPAPDGKFAKLELWDANGKAVPARWGAALELYYDFRKTPEPPPHPATLVNMHPPSSFDTSIERNYPGTISDLEYARYKDGLYFTFAGFASNGPPCEIGSMKINDVFSIKSEGDYSLVVQPVLFRMHTEGGTFQGYLDRVDLPCVTTKVHLVSNVK